MSLVEKWKPILEIGNPVYNEEYTAEVLEELHQRFDTDSVTRLIAPIRQILEYDVTFEFDPEWKSEEPYVIKPCPPDQYVICYESEMLMVMVWDICKTPVYSAFEPVDIKKNSVTKHYKDLHIKVGYHTRNSDNSLEFNFEVTRNGKIL